MRGENHPVSGALEKNFGNLQDFRLMPRPGASHRLARMARSKQLSPTPTELIDWLNGEGLLDLDWDFPEDGDLYEAGMDENVIAHLVEAVIDEYDVELQPEEISEHDLTTPKKMAAYIAKRRS